MNATPREREIASHIYSYLSEQSLGERFSIDTVMALVMTAVSHTRDPDLHLHGERFGMIYQEAMTELNADHSSETDGGQR